MLTGILAVFAISAAAGMRIALPLLVMSLIDSGNFWSHVPLIDDIPPQVVLTVLVSWSLFEVLGSKQLLGQRVLQLLQLALSPLVGLFLAVAIGKVSEYQLAQLWIIGSCGSILALLLQLVQAGWFFRLRGIPPWIAFSEDILSILLVLYAFNAPEQGGLIAMMLLWLAIRSSASWKQWHRHQPQYLEKSITR